MNGIQQIYCTHCTYGSSALERREGGVADRVLGYSARSSSLDQADLRKYYRLLERLLSYYLPTDTPTEEKLRLTAAVAPKRLVYHPDYHGLQLLAQICYRQKDTMGRPGCYFGHVLLGDRATTRWDVLSCLQLWGAGWIEQDSPTLPHALEPLSELKALRQGAKPTINDKLLLSFLTANSANFDDPTKLVPDRWKNKPAAERAGLVIDLLRNYLEFGCNRKETVGLVVEPAVAAILFYGVARLLPPGPLREQLSFSTYEPTLDRLAVTLAATTFHQPQTGDLRPEVYRGRGWVHNTFTGRTSEAPAAKAPAVHGAYARVIVERAVAEGWESVDRFLGELMEAGASSPADLEGLARVNQLAPQLLDPSAEIPRIDGSPATLKYLGRAVRDQLSRYGASQVQMLGGSPRLVKVLNVAAGDAENPQAREAIRSLLARIPETGFAEFLESPGVDPAYKVEALTGYISRQRRFPAGCDSLWDAAPAKPNSAPSAGQVLLSETLPRLEPSQLQATIAKLSAWDLEALWLALARACARYPALRDALGKVVSKMQEDVLCSALRRHGRELANSYPKNEAALGEVLDRWLDGLPHSGEHFSARLEALQHWKEHCADVCDAERKLAAWTKLRDLLHRFKQVGSPASAAPGKAFGKPPTLNDYGALGRQLAELVNDTLMPRLTRAMGNSRESAGNSLRQISAGLLQDARSLPESVRQEIDRCLAGYGWSTSTSSQSNGLGGLGGMPAKKTLIMSGAASLVLLLVVAGLSSMFGTSEAPEQSAASGDNPTERSTSAKTTNDQQPSHAQGQVQTKPAQESTARDGGGSTVGGTAGGAVATNPAPGAAAAPPSSAPPASADKPTPTDATPPGMNPDGTPAETPPDKSPAGQPNVPAENPSTVEVASSNPPATSPSQMHAAPSDESPEAPADAPSRRASPEVAKFSVVNMEEATTGASETLRIPSLPRGEITKLVLRLRDYDKKEKKPDDCLEQETDPKSPTLTVFEHVKGENRRMLGKFAAMEDGSIRLSGVPKQKDKANSVLRLMFSILQIDYADGASRCVALCTPLKTNKPASVNGVEVDFLSAADNEGKSLINRARADFTLEQGKLMLVGDPINEYHFNRDGQINERLPSFDKYTLRLYAPNSRKPLSYRLAISTKDDPDLISTNEREVEDSKAKVKQLLLMYSRNNQDDLLKEIATELGQKSFPDRPTAQEPLFPTQDENRAFAQWEDSRDELLERAKNPKTSKVKLPLEVENLKKKLKGATVHAVFSRTVDSIRHECLIVGDPPKADAPNGDVILNGK